MIPSTAVGSRPDETAAMLAWWKTARARPRAAPRGTPPSHRSPCAPARTSRSTASAAAGARCRRPARPRTRAVRAVPRRGAGRRAASAVPPGGVRAAVGAAQLLRRDIAVVELLGLTVLEAIASGTPVVCSRVDGVTEIVEDGVTGFLVEPRCVDGLRHRLDQLPGEPRSPRAWAGMRGTARSSASCGRRAPSAASPSTLRCSAGRSRRALGSRRRRPAPPTRGRPGPRRPHAAPLARARRGASAREAPR